MALRVTIGQWSAAGRKAENQDFHGALVPEGSALALKGIAVALADGISSSAVGGVAAETAVKTFLTDYYCTSDAWPVKTAAQRVIDATNSWFHAESRRSRHGHDMDRGYVCTFSALVLKGRRAHLFHIGDSRIARLAGGGLEPLTQDHRVVLSSRESYLGRALGMAPNVEIDHRALAVQAGDVFVLTTDGVHEHVPAARIAQLVMEGAGDPDATARRLVGEALDGGSPDNLTIQIVRVEEVPDADGGDALFQADELPAPPVLEPPCLFDGYRVERRIHASSRSHVYLATDGESGAAVVLKIPSVDLRDDPAYRRRLGMEEWIARRLNSAHVLKVAPGRRPRTALYVAMEHVEGQTLRQWMVDNPRPGLEAVRGIAEQIAAGVRAFHRKEMVHRDLRPENILIDRAGTVKLIDFGSTAVAGVIEAAPTVDAGAVLGTLQYTAPECFLGEPATAASDRYAVGAIVYEMLTGRLPYGAAAARVGSRKAVRALRYDPASRDARPVPDWIDAALRRAVHPDPARRYDSLSAFMADLRRPDPTLAPRRHVPLAERDPLLFWRVLSLALSVMVVALLVVLARGG